MNKSFLPAYTLKIVNLSPEEGVDSFNVFLHIMASAAALGMELV